jgi:hypothetical protein
MKFIALFLLFFVTNFSIIEIRELYPSAALSIENAQKFNSKTTASSQNGNTTLGAYKGASLTILAKFAKKIPEKTKLFKQGASLIESAIQKEPTNIELRLIRLSVQENTPKIIKYHANKKEDASYIIAHYKEQENPLRKYLEEFIKESKSFSK